jgi:hypothetical protein
MDVIFEFLDLTRQFSMESYLKSMSWFFKNYNCDLYDGTVLKYLQNEFSEGREPIKEQFEEAIGSPTCMCEFQYDTQILKMVKLDRLSKFGMLYTCEELIFVIQYYTLNKTIPTDEELLEYIRNNIEFENDPEQFHQKDKIHVPTLNLDKLSPIIKDTKVEEYCSLCQEQIGNNAFYKLPNCHHLFHASKEHCLEESCIIDWLSKHKYCPNCKTEVKIE